MWILRWVFIGIIFLAILGFSLNNTQMVHINVLDWQSGDIPIFWVIYIAFAAGMVVFFFVAAYHHFHYKLLLRKCRQKINQLSQELDRLRTVNIGDDFDSDENDDEELKDQQVDDA